ncbi:hypothetical protein F4809DRAFT_4828 [Biscogniauxia mediterranea]|nr:hypothetical protein F4809DRAFT_4828 [Biscogniauxia mediterranea]
MKRKREGKKKKKKKKATSSSTSILGRIRNTLVTVLLFYCFFFLFVQLFVYMLFSSFTLSLPSYLQRAAAVIEGRLRFFRTGKGGACLRVFGGFFCIYNIHTYVLFFQRFAKIPGAWRRLIYSNFFILFPLFVYKKGKASGKGKQETGNGPKGKGKGVRGPLFCFVFAFDHTAGFQFVSIYLSPPPSPPFVVRHISLGGKEDEWHSTTADIFFHLPLEREGVGGRGG